MAIFEIPLQPIAQTFPVSLNGIPFTFHLAWRNAGGSGWVLDIADGSGVALVSGLPLTTGLDLLQQHRHLSIPGQLWLQTDGDPDAVPTYGNLGQDARMFLVTMP